VKTEDGAGRDRTGESYHRQGKAALSILLRCGVSLAAMRRITCSDASYHLQRCGASFNIKNIAVSPAFTK
jgi:hypothetical protein